MARTETVEYLEGEEVALADLAEALESGAAHWSDWDPELKCSMRQSVAYEECLCALADVRESIAAAKARTAVHAA